MQWFKKSKLLFRQMTGQELDNGIELTCQTVKMGGWVFSPLGLNSSTIVFSLGTADDIRFETGMINRFGCEVHAFDPTPRWVEWIKTQNTLPQFHFHPLAIGSRDGTLRMYPRINGKGKVSSTMITMINDSADETLGIEVPVKKISTLMTELDISSIDILKMDIEGAEYEVIDDLLNSGVQVYQLLVEFHHRFKSIPINKTKSALRRLNSAGYRLFHISEKYWEFSFIHDKTYKNYLQTLPPATTSPL